MNEKNVIRFHAEHKLEAACTETDMLDLVKWRSKLHKEGLVGQDPARYEGLGYGNLSKKIREGTYLITGSQTGHLENLSPHEFAKITGFDPAENKVWSSGMCRPSSETMTIWPSIRTIRTFAMYFMFTARKYGWRGRS
jgi:L-ribulose-5-phosphate 4-epimerase